MHLPPRLPPLLLHLQVGAASHLFTEERGPYLVRVRARARVRG